jgi:hypothetical protein
MNDLLKIGISKINMLKTEKELQIHFECYFFADN